MSNEKTPLTTALELLSFHEGSAAPERDGDRPTVRINGEDLAQILASVRASKGLIDRAVGVLQRHIAPDGLNDGEAITAMYDIFDGPDYFAAS